jgi:XTP/dITP diphosphohydrolase
VRSARFAIDAGIGHGDAANNALLLLLLDVVPEARRTARFVSHVTARLPDGRFVEARGTVEGHIARDELGGGGFGYDPLFVPVERAPKRMAELSSDEKHAISHRGRAMRALLAELEPLLR